MKNTKFKIGEFANNSAYIFDRKNKVVDTLYIDEIEGNKKHWTHSGKPLSHYNLSL